MYSEQRSLTPEPQSLWFFSFHSSKYILLSLMCPSVVWGLPLLTILGIKREVLRKYGTCNSLSKVSQQETSASTSQSMPGSAQLLETSYFGSFHILWYFPLKNTTFISLDCIQDFSAQKSIGCSFRKYHELKRLHGVRAQSSRAFARESTPVGPKRICKKVFQVLSLSLSECSGDCIKISMGICISSFLMSDHKITGYLFTCHHHNKTLA